MRTVRGIVTLGEAQSIPMRGRGECPTLDKIQNAESSVQIRVQLVGDGTKRQNGWALAALDDNSQYLENKYRLSSRRSLHGGVLSGS